MLKSLKEHDRKTVELVLSAYTSALLPNPGVGSQHDSQVDPAVYESVREEIHRLLRTTPSDLSPANRTKVLQFLAREMSEVALEHSDIRSIKERIGQRGDLRPDFYEIQFEDRFRISEEFGVRRNHVTETIKHPDCIEKPLSDRLNSLTLHVKTHNKMNERERFSLLVISTLNGLVFSVDSAFRIYHADVNVSKVWTPLDLLRALSEKYGLVCNVGTKAGKFILYEAVEASSGTPFNDIIKIDSSDSFFLAHASYDKSPIHRLYEFALVFALDRVTLAADLEKHGVHLGDIYMGNSPGALP